MAVKPTSHRVCSSRDGLMRSKRLADQMRLSLYGPTSALDGGLTAELTSLNSQRGLNCRSERAEFSPYHRAQLPERSVVIA